MLNEKELNELDEWIAINVMGLKLNANGMIETWPDPKRPELRDDLCVQNYTTDKAAAMEVLEKCCEKEVVRIDGKAIVLDDGGWIEGDTLQLSICLFAKELFQKGR